jgi:penicillin-binding protein 2
MRYRKGDGERSGLFTRRALLLGGAQAVLLSALAGRLYQLQVIETRRFATLAEENRTVPPAGAVARPDLRPHRPAAWSTATIRAMVTSDRGRGWRCGRAARPDPEPGRDRQEPLLRELDAANAQPIGARDPAGGGGVAEFNAPDLPGVSPISARRATIPKAI